MPSDLTLNAQPMGGARPGAAEVDDIASTLVWQKGPDAGAAPPPRVLPAGAATLNGPGPAGPPPTSAAPLAGTRLGATAVAPLGATAVSKLGATAVANMLAATTR
ncbi:MAG: hypothetical protein R3F14_24135 [Polyangiaceae bacterium]